MEESQSFGWVVSLIGGIVIAIILKQPITFASFIYPTLILVISLVAILIGFYIDYKALYEYRDEEPVVVKSLVMNVVALIGGIILMIALLIIGGM